MSTIGAVGRDDLSAAEALLGQALGSWVRLRVVREFRVGRAARDAVAGSESPSVVVKVANPGDAYHGLDTLHNEQASLVLLDRPARGLAPKLLGADPAAGVLVLEDLGDEPSLASCLLGDDPSGARQAAIDTAAGLGALPAATIGHAGEYERLRSSLGDTDSRAGRVTLRGVNIEQRIADLRALLAAHHLPPPIPGRSPGGGGYSGYTTPTLLAGVQPRECLGHRPGGGAVDHLVDGRLDCLGLAGALVG